MNWMSMLGLCLIVLGTIFSFFGTVKSSNKTQTALVTKIQEKNKTIDDIKEDNTKLVEQNTNLLNASKQSSETNSNLYMQNHEMLERISNYQSDIEERNKKIGQLETRVNEIKEYSYYATLNMYGVVTMPGYGLKYSGGLYDKMDKIYIQKDGKFYVKQDISVMPIINEVIKDFPKFPFGYWSKYQLLKMAGQKGWQDYAQKAIEIFKITTTIEGHSPTHDEAMNAALSDLATSKK